MKHAFFTSLVVLATSVACVYADSFKVGSKSIEIPAPKGFVRVTPKMGKVKRFFDQLVDPANRTLANYISDADAPLAFADEIPELDQTFAVNVNRQLADAELSPKDFAELKAVLKSQNKEMYQKAKAQVEKNLKKASKGVSKELDVDLAMNVTNMVPLEPHVNEKNAFAFSMYVNYSVQSGNEKEDWVVAATGTIVNVSGKIVALYCYAPKDQLEWTRQASKEWSAKVLSSNGPPPSQSSGLGNGGGRGARRYGWIVALVVGGIIFLVKKLRS